MKLDGKNSSQWACESRWCGHIALFNKGEIKEVKGRRSLLVCVCLLLQLSIGDFFVIPFFSSFVPNCCFVFVIDVVLCQGHRNLVSVIAIRTNMMKNTNERRCTGGLRTRLYQTYIVRSCTLAFPLFGVLCFLCCYCRCCC